MHRHMIKRKTQGRERKLEKKQITGGVPEARRVGTCENQQKNQRFTDPERKERGMGLDSEEFEGGKAKKMWWFLYVLLK